MGPARSRAHAQPLDHVVNLGGNLLIPSTMSLVKPVRGEHLTSKSSEEALAELLEQECDPVSNVLTEQLLFARHGLHDTSPCPDGRLTWRVIETQARPLGGGDIGAEKLSRRNVTGRGYNRARLG